MHGRARGWLLPASAVIAVVLVGLIALAVAARSRPAAAAPLRPATSRMVSVPAQPGSTARILLDTDLYLPARTPAPAVLLAHGFGQTKRDLVGEAKRLQGRGYVVLAYTARGFGRSGGRISLDSLDAEVPDARALVDLLAHRGDVLHRQGDPVVGAVGASYGGALALMLGATDPRIDTVVAGITWNDLAEALDPSSAATIDGQGAERTFKAGWAARLFGTGSAGEADPCSRFTAQLCSLYRRLVGGGALTAADRALLDRSSPSAVLSGTTAPTLLVQGLRDSLFGLDQADASARQIRAAGARVRVDWFDGGHDAGADLGATDDRVDRWLDARLKAGYPPWRRFDYAVPASATSFPEQHIVSTYPGLDGSHLSAPLDLEGGDQTVVNPPGGRPASVTSIPGLTADSAVGQQAEGLLARTNPPNQAARFTSAPVGSTVLLGGAARVRVAVTPLSGRAEDLVLFAQLSAVTGSSSRPLPGGVAPVHVRLPAGGAVLDVALPGTVWQFAPGDRIRLTLRTTDSQFSGATAPASFRVRPAGALVLPELQRRAARQIETPSRAALPRIGLLLGVIAALVIAAVVIGRVRRRRALRLERRADGAGSPVPALAVRDLTKRFRSGFLAVDAVSFTVRRGQVVGLLGENGAGKTTTMRMLLGLTRPDSGRVEAFGVRVEPGSPVLRRVGAFVEGPGFVPHLSGRRNLRLYWAATGRPRREARFEEVLAVADLGRAVRRPVRGYSQGMRQRLAIAQAMLGMPDVLVLDEPTNGLDPPQITALRGVLRRYAEAGRAVVVSSHLLGEVEQTCTHVVVMSHGRVVADGPLREVAGTADQVTVEVDDPAAAVDALLEAGATHAESAGSAVRVLPGRLSLHDVLAALVRAGVVIRDVSHGGGLEEAFLDLIGSAEPGS